jgi:DNA-directed RNA polymerase specialized sigma subunit
MTSTTGLVQIMSDRQAICDYLADLPQLDRQVLFRRFAKRENLRTIASDLQITSTHVERIVQRSDEFRRSLSNRTLMAA